MVPHPPQFVRSFWLSTHDIPHFAVPIAHEVAHAPAMQTSFAAHAFPQEPQLRGSLLLSTHSVPHFVVLLPHALAHVPAEQTSPIAHALPHAPQLAGSRAITVQGPSQLCAPSPQLIVFDELLHAAANPIPTTQHPATTNFASRELVMKP